MSHGSLRGLRGGIYARKSSYRGKTGNRGRSVREQLQVGRDAATQLGVEIVEEFVDDDRSASRYRDREREEFTRMIEWIERKQLDIVFAWAATRLQRDLAVYARLRDACADNGVLWWYGGKVYDLSNKDDRFRTGLDALLGEREVEELRDNVRRTLRANAVAGRPHGPISPYGYKRVYDKHTGEFVRVEVEPAEAKIVREIFERVAAGEAYNGIARDLQDRGTPPPAVRWRGETIKRVANDRPRDTKYLPYWQEIRERLAAGTSPAEIARDYQARGVPLFGARWTSTTVKKFASDVRYLGLRTHHGEVTAEDAWPAIVPKSTFARCQAMINERKSKKVGTRPGKARYLVSRIAVCDVCESLLSSNTRTGGGMSYACRRRPGPNGEKGYHAAAPMELVDRYVKSRLFEWLSSPSFIAAFTQSDDELLRKAEEAAAEAQLLNKRLQKFREKAIEGALSAESLSAVEAGLLPKIKAAEEHAKKLRAPSVVRDVVGASPEEVESAWNALTLPQQRHIVGAGTRGRKTRCADFGLLR